MTEKLTTKQLIEIASRNYSDDRIAAGLSVNGTVVSMDEMLQRCADPVAVALAIELHKVATSPDPGLKTPAHQLLRASLLLNDITKDIVRVADGLLASYYEAVAIEYLEFLVAHEVNFFRASFDCWMMLHGNSYDTGSYNIWNSAVLIIGSPDTDFLTVKQKLDSLRQPDKVAAS